MTDSGDEFFFNNVIMYLSSWESDSEDESEILVATLVVNDHISRMRPMFRGSIPDHAPALDRDRGGGHAELYKDYFHPTNPVYTAKLFRRRFRMKRDLFNRI
ncbi:Nuclear pore complex protein [Hordeum vulgare]|nr:Nuclear pore complex protein [Hordeum vulgare]